MNSIQNLIIDEIVSGQLESFLDNHASKPSEKQEYNNAVYRCLGFLDGLRDLVVIGAVTADKDHLVQNITFLYGYKNDVSNIHTLINHFSRFEMGVEL